MTAKKRETVKQVRDQALADLDAVFEHMKYAAEIHGLCDTFWEEVEGAAEGVKTKGFDKERWRAKKSIQPVIELDWWALRGPASGITVQVQDAIANAVSKVLTDHGFDPQTTNPSVREL